MTTLIIHPDDRSTTFLKDIYQHLEDATVVTKNISQHTLHELIRSHDQIVMLGHGSPYGLFNVARIGDGGFTIGTSEAPLLKDKQCIFIWCHADQYVRKHGLKGLSSGMFISEVGEALYCGLPATPQEEVDESNFGFVNIIGKYINEPKDLIYENVMTEYGVLAENNRVASYNHKRLYKA
mgnify:CR=1 FL=1